MGAGVPVHIAVVKIPFFYKPIFLGVTKGVVNLFWVLSFQVIDMNLNMMCSQRSEEPKIDLSQVLKD